MFNNKIIFVFVAGFVGLCGYQCLKFIPERVQAFYYDEQYFNNGSINVRRTRRGGEYGVNLNFTLMHYEGNNVTVSLYFFEFLHNEYKPSFIEVHIKLCDLMLQDKFFGGALRKVGFVTCPVTPGIYVLKNMGFNEAIPSVWPFDRGMLRVVLTHVAKPKGIIGRAEVMLRFINNVPAKREPKSHVVGNRSLT